MAALKGELKRDVILAFDNENCVKSVTEKQEEEKKLTDRNNELTYSVKMAACPSQPLSNGNMSSSFPRTNTTEIINENGSIPLTKSLRAIDEAAEDIYNDAKRRRWEHRSLQSMKRTSSLQHPRRNQRTVASRNNGFHTMGNTTTSSLSMSRSHSMRSISADRHHRHVGASNDNSDMSRTRSSSSGNSDIIRVRGGSNGISDNVTRVINNSNSHNDMSRMRSTPLMAKMVDNPAFLSTNSDSSNDDTGVLCRRSRNSPDVHLAILPTNVMMTSSFDRHGKSLDRRSFRTHNCDASYADVIKDTKNGSKSLQRQMSAHVITDDDVSPTFSQDDGSYESLFSTSNRMTTCHQRL